MQKEDKFTVSKREWQHFAEKMRQELGGKERGKKGKRKGRDRERHEKEEKRNEEWKIE